MKSEILNQAAYPPFEEQSALDEYIAFISKEISWDSISIISDEGSSNILIVTVNDDVVVSSLRINLPPADFINTVKKLSKDKKVKLVYLQGDNISESDLSSLDAIQKIAFRAKEQSAIVELPIIEEFITRIDEGSKKKGRGESFGRETRQAVNLASHGRCMFTGCGENLRIDDLTGDGGNYSYLAHNVASSENGERGIPVLSGILSNDPKNILLLCDKHHRLIDRVAACNYPAEKLSVIREQFISDAEELLDGLKFQPIPVYSVLWPVNTHVVSPPNKKEIANCLSTLELRMQGSLNKVLNSDGATRSVPELQKIIMPSSIKIAAEKIIQQTNDSGHSAALFAFGPMPSLVGLGAILGNKSQYIPMLRYRDGATWMWPKQLPGGEFYIVEGLDSIKPSEDIIICIALTAFPEVMKKKASELSDELDSSIIIYSPKYNAFGNGAIPHPIDGMKFSARLQYDFHTFKSQYGVKRMHVLICASNAAAVFIGQAFDLHHPEMIVYDFRGESMEAVISIANDSSETSINSII